MFEAQMRENARQAESRYGPLLEVIFLQAPKDSRLVFSRAVVEAHQLANVFCFGYSGTGSRCFAAFLGECGFTNTGRLLDTISTPAKLAADGRWTQGQRKSAQREVEGMGSTVEQARSNLPPSDVGTECVIREEILCDGTQVERIETVEGASGAEALGRVLSRIPAGSEVVSSEVESRSIESTEEIVAQTEPEADALARARISARQALYKSLVEVQCLKQPREGFSLGRRPGRFRARYSATGHDVRLCILCDETETELIETVQVASGAEALGRVLSHIPAGSEVVSSEVESRSTESTEEIVAQTGAEAEALARAKISPQEASYKSLVQVQCVEPPRKALVSLGERPGRFRARYSATSQEVRLVYRPPARIRVTYGPTKLRCTQCGGVMAATTEGVTYGGQPPTAEAQILKLRCDACDLTRFEKRWEIEGRWIEWEDGSQPTIL